MHVLIADAVVTQSDELDGIAQFVSDIQTQPESAKQRKIGEDSKHKQGWREEKYAQAKISELFIESCALQAVLSILLAGSNMFLC